MPVRSTEVLIPADFGRLPGTLRRPGPGGPVVLFAHGSGSSRLSRRNRLVADALVEAGLGTLLFDLLSEPEALDRRNVFDVELLARCLHQARRWVGEEVDPVPGATHLFEERGALEEVARLAAGWLVRHLTGAPLPAGHEAG